MDIQSDFKELLEWFNSHKVEYLITGAYALAFHGVPRYTGDIDLFVNPDPANAIRIISALNEFGFGSLELKAEDIKMDQGVRELEKQSSSPWFDPLIRVLVTIWIWFSGIG